MSYLASRIANSEYGIDRELNKYFVSAAYLKKVVEEYVDKQKISSVLDLHKMELTKKAERKEIWKLWFQKTIRWIAGVTIAVLLYTFFVWLEGEGIVTLPVRDLFISK